MTRNHPWHANRATSWHLRTRTLEFSASPLIMGIVNVTPDSFSDGGSYIDPSRAVDHALSLAAAGAAILDIGGESTRPYSTPVDAAEECRRVQPVIRELSRQCDVPLSIDTSKPEVARMAIDEGVQILNDVTGFEDPEMISLGVNSQCGLCAMHMQGTPQTMQDNPTYGDVVDDIHTYLIQRREQLTAAGIAPQRICLDPGIGFGKSHQHNLTLMANCWKFHETGCPLLVGHSRKGFIAKTLNDKERDRAFGTVGSALVLAQQGIHVIRVHDVAALRDALLLFSACGGIDGNELRLEEG